MDSEIQRINPKAGPMIWCRNLLSRFYAQFLLSLGVAIKSHNSIYTRIFKLTHISLILAEAEERKSPEKDKTPSPSSEEEEEAEDEAKNIFGSDDDDDDDLWTS